MTAFDRATFGAALAAIALTIGGCADQSQQALVLGQAETAKPPKDCTRYNGTFGFYGNRWCTAAEQEAWDRWEASQVKRD